MARTRSAETPKAPVTAAQPPHVVNNLLSKIEQFKAKVTEQKATIVLLMSAVTPGSKGQETLEVKVKRLQALVKDIKVQNAQYKTE